MATTLKRFFLIALSLIAITGCQSTKNTMYQPIELTQVVDIPNKSKEEIYNKARQWFSQYFVSGKSVVDYEDKKEGVIIGNGVADNGSMMGVIKYKFYYNIRIDTKDGKFRALTTITKHTNTDSNSTYDTAVVDQERVDASKQKINDLIAQIKAYILKENIQEDTW